MDYSLTVRKMTIGPAKGKELYVANPVCQKQRVSFEKLCERMAEDTTVGEADIAAVFYKFRKGTQPTLFGGLYSRCRTSRIVPPIVYVESGRERRRFQALALYH